MEYGKQDSAPSGIKDLRQRLKRLWIFFAIFQALSLTFILISIESAVYRNKSSLAHSLTEALSNPLLVKDYRRVTEVLSTSSKNEFIQIEVKDYSSNKTIDITHQSKAIFAKSIAVPIYFDSAGNTKIGEAIFLYRLFSLVLETFLSWLFLLIISSFWIYQFRKSTIKSYEKEIELALARRFSDLSRKVAHDIRSPLSALNMMVGHYKSIPEEQKEIIQQVILRINGIADDLLNDTKKQSVPTQQITNSTQELKKYKIIPAIKNLVNEKNLEVKNIPGVEVVLRLNNCLEDIEVAIPDKSIQRILSNLINNSIDAMTDNGMIFIEVQNRAPTLIVSVIDFGKGIPADILERLNQKEFLSHGKEKSNRSGSGIGLESAYRDLQEVGGSLKIESKLEIGTRVTIELPLVNTTH